MYGNLLILSQQFENRISNRLMSMKIHFFDLCVKSEPMSLMGIEVPGGASDHIEDYVDVCKKDDKTLLLVPHDNVDIRVVAAAVETTHPEFIKEFLVYTKSADSDEKVAVLSLTVPPVNKDRKDLLEKAVNTYKDAYVNYVDVEKNLTKVKMAGYLDEATKEDKDEIEELFKNKSEEYKNSAQKAADDKIKEIEEAYQRYLEEKAQCEIEADKLSSAINDEAANTLKMIE